MHILRKSRNFAFKLSEYHYIMKNLFLKSRIVCIFFFLCLPVVRAQDSNNSEQTGIYTLRNYIANAQYRQAIEYINRLEPTKDLLYQKALCCKNINEYPKAIEILDSLSKEYPDDIPVKLQLAQCYEVVSQFPKSIDCYNQLLMIDSTNTYFKVQKADLFYRSEKFDSAIEAYSQIDTTYNQNYVTRAIAMCYEKMNQSDSAKSYYEKAWGLNERDAYSANSLVKIQVKKEDYLSAYQNSEKFIEKDSANATMNALNAYVYYNMKYYDIAIERFQKCLQQGDSLLLVSRSLGFLYYLTDKDSLARPFLRQAFQQDTTNTNVLYILGKVNYTLGNYPEAVECFRNVIDKLIPTDVMVRNLYKGLAASLEKKGDFDSAWEAYHKALNQTEDNKDKMEIFFAMAVMADTELKNYEQAVVYYKQYRLCLFNYQNSLKDEKEISEVESKLTALDQHIKELTGKNALP